MDIHVYLMRVIKLEKGRLTLQEDQILGFMERTVTHFGNSAKVDCPKEHLGKTVYLVICKE
jgi:putative transposon-encoded protein